MSYFQYTGQDLAKQRAAGIEEAKRETGEALLALVQDTNDKLNADELDRTYIIEDFLARCVALAHESGADISLFEVGNIFCRHVPAYPIGEGRHNPDAEVTQEIPRVEPTLAPLVSASTLREAHNGTHFDGIQRHPFEVGEGASGMACTRMVTRNGFGEDCGLPFDNAIHDWMW